jgi:drug/metabolite transporter (DMT)-like permease
MTHRLSTLGLTLCLSSSVLQNVGLGLQKSFHLSQSPTSAKPYFLAAAWWLATAVFVVGLVCDFLSLSLLPASVAVPVGGLGLVVSALYSTLYLHEAFSMSDCFGTLLIAVGASLTIFLHRGPSAPNTPASALHRAVSEPGSTYLLAVSCLFLSALSTRKGSTPPAFIGVSLPGTVGALSTLLGKVVAEFTRTTKLLSPAIFVTASALAALLVLQNHLLQQTIATYRHVVTVPLYYGFVCAFSCAGGVFFFGEFVGASQPSLIVFAVALFCVFVGVWQLSKPAVVN